MWGEKKKLSVCAMRRDEVREMYVHVDAAVTRRKRQTVVRDKDRKEEKGEECDSSTQWLMTFIL